MPPTRPPSRPPRRDGGHDDGQCLDQEVEDIGQAGEAGDLAEGENQGQRDEGRDRADHDPADADPPPGGLAARGSARRRAAEGRPVRDAPQLRERRDVGDRPGHACRPRRAGGADEAQPELLGLRDGGAAGARGGDVGGHGRGDRRRVGVGGIGAHQDQAVDPALLDGGRDLRVEDARRGVHLRQRALRRQRRLPVLERPQLRGGAVVGGVHRRARGDELGEDQLEARGLDLPLGVEDELGGVVAAVAAEVAPGAGEDRDAAGG